MPTRALTWAIFTAAAILVAGLCMAMLHPFAHVIAWAASLAILCTPLQQKLVERTGRVAVSGPVAFATAAAIVETLRQRAVAARSSWGES